MLYVLVTIHLATEKLEEFTKVFTEEYRPSREKYGGKLVGAWTRSADSGSPSEIINLWVYEDMSARERAQEAHDKDEKFRKAGAKIRSIILDLTSRYLMPFPYSPLK